ncbi:Pol polyprotein, partial [Caligus rogercresseyi]
MGHVGIAGHPQGRPGRDPGRTPLWREPSFTGVSPSTVDAAHLDNATVGFANQLRDQVAKLQPKQPATHAGGIKEANSYIPTALKKATHVYVRLDRVRRPLERPYEGPFPVVKLSPST